MKILRSAVIVFSGLSALSLAACGEGYEVVKIRGSVPYVEERTAGPGVAYVRAHMMPEKTVVLPEQLLSPQVQDAEPIFDKKMQKK
jgi:hypothetical protein